MNYVVKGKSRKELRDMALLVRKIEGAENELYFPILDFMEKTLPTLVPDFSFRICDKSEMGNCEGLTFPEKKEIVIRNDVYDKAVQGCGRERLTIAHELYHFLGHSDQTIALARTSGVEIPAYMDPEWQADAFGGELLVPYHLAKNLTVNQIEVLCGVSHSAATVQYGKMH